MGSCKKEETKVGYMKYHPFAILLTIAFPVIAKESFYCSSDTHQCVVVDEKKEHILKASNHIENSIELSKKIADEENRLAISARLESCKKSLEADLLFNDYSAAFDKVEGLYENLGEIISDCSEQGLMDEISAHVCGAMDEMRKTQSL